jgi:glycosyltransferase involved in cell wall biosynthesis
MQISRSQNGHGNTARTGSAVPGLTANTAAPYRRREDSAELDLTLFVACYNEQQNIVATLNTIQAAMRELPLTYEVIVIDDASRDSTVDVVKEYQLRNPSLPLTLVECPKNHGLAHNFAEASFLGRGRYYKLVCGDNVEAKETLLDVLEHVGKADIIVPYHRQCEGRSRFRLFLSRTYTALINALSGYSLRYYNGCGVYRRVDVMRWHSRTAGFGFQAELLIALLDKAATYVQVPIVGRDRQSGSSSALGLRNWLAVSRTLLGILFRPR